MRSTVMFAVLALLVVTTGVTAEEKRPTGSATNSPVLYMKHVGGWVAGVLCEFSVEADGAFWWKVKNDNRLGVIPKPELRKLIAHVVAAGPGPEAKDAGTVEFKWVDQDGKERVKVYSYPDQDPCQRLLREIDALTAKHKTESTK
jgi:hypothetical protein